MHYLITGGTGYLAQAIARSLVSRGDVVTLASRGTWGRNPLIPEIRHLKVDYENSDSIFRILENVDIVIHCAGLDAAKSLANPVMAERVNSEYTRNLVKGSRGLAKGFIYVSTIHVYNNILGGEITEDTEAANLHPYALSHLHGEEWVSKYANSFPLGAFSVRLSNTFGTPIDDISSGWELFINRESLRAVKESRIQIKSDPLTQRNFIPLESASQLILDISSSIDRDLGQTVYNIGAQGNLSLHSAAKLIRDNALHSFDMSIHLDYQLPSDDTATNDYFIFRSKYSDFPKIDYSFHIGRLLKLISTRKLLIHEP